MFFWDSSDDPHETVKTILDKYSNEPESEAQFKKLLPQINLCFGSNKSVKETIEELKRHEANTDAAGTVLGCPC